MFALDVIIIIFFNRRSSKLRDRTVLNEVVPCQSLEFIFQLVDEVVESVFQMCDTRDQQVHGRLQLLLLSLLLESTFKACLNGNVRSNLNIKMVKKKH